MEELSVFAGDFGLSPELPNLTIPQKTKKPARSLGELLTDPSLLEEPEVLIPYLAVASRITLLSGREKSGKSTLTAQLIADATTGRPIFGQPASPRVSVLWYAIDEPLGDTVRRLQTLGADLDHLFISDAPRTWQELVECLAEDLAEHPGVSLVVIDTLSRLLSTVDVNSSEKVEPVLWRLKDHLFA